LAHRHHCDSRCISRHSPTAHQPRIHHSGIEHIEHRVVAVGERPAARYQLTAWAVANGLELPAVADELQAAHQLSVRVVHLAHAGVDGVKREWGHGQ